MRVESWVGVAIVGVMVSGSVVVAKQSYARLMLPANVELISNIGQELQRIYDASPTFRAQCERIAGAKSLRVRIRINPSMPSRCRAYTIIQRQGYAIQADVHLPPSGDHSELVAHEFEHLLEQIEGLNLQRLARVRGSGVFEVEQAIYETERAQAAGRVVAEEFRQFRTRAAD